jgi:hypothetical protein
MKIRAGIATTAVIALVSGACGGRSTAANCSDTQRLIEPGSIHVLPGNDVRYDYSPPTSGAHQVPAPESGASSEPIAEPRQVAALEVGFVLVQYSSAASAEDIVALESLASIDGVIVAPAVRPFDQDAAYAFTAWTQQQLCEGLDLKAAEAFVDRYLVAFLSAHE